MANDQIKCMMKELRSIAYLTMNGDSSTLLEDEEPIFTLPNFTGSLVSAEPCTTDVRSEQDDADEIAFKQAFEHGVRSALTNMDDEEKLK